MHANNRSTLSAPCWSWHTQGSNREGREAGQSYHRAIFRLHLFFAFAALILLSLAGPVRAQIPSVPDFRAYTFSGYSDGSGPYFIIDNFGPTYLDSPVPNNISYYNHTSTYSGPNGDVTFTSTAAANYRGFWSTGTYAEGHVSNVSYPTDAAPSSSPPFGYYVIGGMGSFTTHRFETPLAANDPFAVFHWHVSGTADANFGTINSRLDFGVGQNVQSFNDLYNPNVVPNIMTEFGPGEYSYTIPVVTGTTLDFLFWSSSFWEVDPAQLANLPSNLHDIHGIAEFTRTFNMDSIDLYNGDPNNGGTLIPEWSLVDDASNQVIFNQNGRVTATVPEPGSLALLIGLSLGSITLLRKRRRK